MFSRPLQILGRSAIALRYYPRVQRAWNSSSTAASTKFGEPEWAKREEPVAGYAEERGYIEVSVGQELGGYTVLRKLGWGSGSTVWLAQRKSDQVYAALKVTQGIDQDPADSPQRRELAFLQRTRAQSPSYPGHSRIVQLYDAFPHPHSRAGHQCIAMEPLSQQLALFAEHRCRNHRLPSGLVRHVVRQVLEALDFLHVECNIVHTDIKADNIMLGVSEADIHEYLAATAHAKVDTAVLFPGPLVVTRTQSWCIGVPVPPGDPNLYESWAGVDVKLTDLGMACWADKTSEYYTDLPSSSALRAPEACIGAGWGKPADIWSVACLAYELSMGASLIQTNCDRYAVPFYQAFHFGDLPMDMVKRGKYSSHFYNEDGSLKMEFERRVSVEEMVRRRPPLHDADLFIDFLKRAFALDPNHRPTARELLTHKWLQY